MKCQNEKCKCDDIYVVNTWKYSDLPDSVVRIRACRKCGTIWKSYENPDKTSVQIGYMDEIEPSLFDKPPVEDKTLFQKNISVKK